MRLEFVLANLFLNSIYEINFSLPIYKLVLEIEYPKGVMKKALAKWELFRCKIDGWDPTAASDNSAIWTRNPAL